MKPCNGLPEQILESSKEDKDVADATTDNFLRSFQVVCKYHNEEEEKTIFQVVPHSFLFLPVIIFHSNCIKMHKIIHLLKYDCMIKPLS